MRRLLLAFGLLTTCAAAAVIDFTDKASWTAAAKPTTAIGFEGIAPSGQMLDVPHPGLMLGGILFSGDISFDRSVAIYSNTPPGPGGPMDPFNWGTGDLLWTLSRTTLTLAQGTYAIGLEVGVTASLYTGFQYPIQFTAVTSSGQNLFTIDSSTNQSLVFWGLVSDTPITTLIIDSATLQVIDNVQFAAIPEPVSSLLAVTGLAVLTLLRITRRMVR